MDFDIATRQPRGFCRSRAYVWLVAMLVGPLPAMADQNAQAIDFAQLIRTPEGIQKTLERCDGHPDFETALTNWLETAEPRSSAERAAIRTTSLRLLEDTTDRQVVLGLIDGLLRHTVIDLTRDPALVPYDVARSLYVEIYKSVRGQRSKADMIAVVTGWMAEDRSVADARPATFVKEVQKMAEPHWVRRPRVPTNSREAADGERRASPARE
jgi:hypothetical protein